tara:strand:+ start:215 stop:1405 length:1191 start_codon:yes stop_codon:yes gene_type:complete
MEISCERLGGYKRGWMIRSATSHGILEVVEPFLAAQPGVTSCCIQPPHLEAVHDEVFLVLDDTAHPPLATFRQAILDAIRHLRDGLRAEVVQSTDRLTQLRLVGQDAGVLEALRKSACQLPHLCVDTIRVVRNTSHNHSNDVAAKLFDLVVAETDDVTITGGLTGGLAGGLTGGLTGALRLRARGVDLADGPLVRVRDVDVCSSGVRLLNAPAARLLALRSDEELVVEMDLDWSSSCIINCWYGHRVRFSTNAGAIGGLGADDRRRLFDTLRTIEPTCFAWHGDTFRHAETCVPLANVTRILTAQQTAKEKATDPDFVTFEPSFDVCDFFIETNGERRGDLLFSEMARHISAYLEGLAEGVLLSRQSTATADRSFMPHRVGEDPAASPTTSEDRCP